MPNAPCSMLRREAKRLTLLGALALGLLLVSQPGLAVDLPQARTQVQDLLRGVSMNSVLVSDEPVIALDVVDGEFSEVDRIAIGLSVMSSYGSKVVEDYILWVRHEGRQWLDAGLDGPVSIAADNNNLELSLLRSPSPFIGDGGRFFEKFEFRLTPESLDSILQSSSVTVTVRSDTGTVNKSLGEAEVEVMRQFLASLDLER